MQCRESVAACGKRSRVSQPEPSSDAHAVPRTQIQDLVAEKAALVQAHRSQIQVLVAEKAALVEAHAAQIQDLTAEKARLNRLALEYLVELQHARIGLMQQLRSAQAATEAQRVENEELRAEIAVVAQSRSRALCEKWEAG